MHTALSETSLPASAWRFVELVEPGAIRMEGWLHPGRQSKDRQTRGGLFKGGEHLESL